MRQRRGAAGGMRAILGSRTCPRGGSVPIQRVCASWHKWGRRKWGRSNNETITCSKKLLRPPLSNPHYPNRLAGVRRLSETEAVRVVSRPGWPAGEHCGIYTNGESNVLSWREVVASHFARSSSLSTLLSSSICASRNFRLSALFMKSASAELRSRSFFHCSLPVILEKADSQNAT